MQQDVSNVRFLSDKKKKKTWMLVLFSIKQFFSILWKITRFLILWRSEKLIRTSWNMKEKLTQFIMKS